MQRLHQHIDCNHIYSILSSLARDGQFLLFKFVFDRLANDKNKLEETDCFGIRNDNDIHILLIKNEQFRYFRSLVLK